MRTTRLLAGTQREGQGLSEVGRARSSGCALKICLKEAEGPNFANEGTEALQGTGSPRVPERV